MNFSRRNKKDKNYRRNAIAVVYRGAD